MPTSPPSEIECVPISENSLEFSWNRPIKAAPSITMYQYEYLHIVDNIGDMTMEKEVKFDRLMPATTYSFGVKYKGGKKSVKVPNNGANCTDPTADCLELSVVLESALAIINCTTLPLRLTGLSHSKISFSHPLLILKDYLEMNKA